ncbi:hypothetical protein O181_039913 [Austropuccinia psidii MF-1]|uniref:Uncharacterized protein n=1 Tax=Austropuccinia psidii MF-1 TaxID=1389203 RepID=A0A9Q3HCD8_9BASI|nr:hypothetical protein [Austropuccinia psidii MF-1]
MAVAWMSRRMGSDGAGKNKRLNVNPSLQARWLLESRHTHLDGFCSWSYGSQRTIRNQDKSKRHVKPVELKSSHDDLMSSHAWASSVRATSSNIMRHLQSHLFPISLSSDIKEPSILKTGSATSYPFGMGIAHSELV